MEILIIWIIVFVIWVVVKISGGSSQSGTNKTKTTYEPKYDYQKELERKQADERRKEQERIRKENEERLRREQEEQRSLELIEKQKRQEAEEKRRIAERQRNWKTNWQDFQRLISEKNITVLYHFTDKANLQSIRNNGGLYSWEYCEDNNIRITFPGGDDLSRSLDKRYNLENYVRLCFTKNHPMMYVAQKQGRINNPVILEIDPEVIYWKDTLFSDMNATKTGYTKGDTLTDFQRIKFDLVKQRNHFDIADELQKYYQAEVMVKKHIPLAFIKNINDFETNYSINKSIFDINDDFPF